MPDKRSHRGPHPEDRLLFAADRWPALQNAVRDLSWLLSHGYALNSALKLVGDRFQLTERQRIAVMRSTCSAESLAGRRERRIPLGQTAGQRLALDGYNVLTTVEAALGGGVLFRGMDGCLRDLASMHGHYKRVAETGPALELIGAALAALNTGPIDVLLDAPVSNSGRLKTIMVKFATDHGLTWSVTLVPDPDPILALSPAIIATADSVILDGARNPAGAAKPRWTNLAAHIVETHVSGATIVPLNVV
ncbi:MAG TPA: DUF434 domain-containing protein [Phycisphaerae bacterium]|jgi:hypothetical protein|nr:DUF434 domain-containing protein [Phycisphaerae bacterium]